MFEKNTIQVNKIITRSLAVCSIMMLGLVILHIFGIFNFQKELLYTISVFGILVTISPFVLSFFNVPDSFLKYYTLIAMAVYIGALGRFTGIGIYITYALVPVVSSLYFSRKLTAFCSIFSYLCMTVAVWINTSNRWETQYQGWSHAITFRNYMIGFTFEYLIMIIFIYQLVSRAGKMMREQHDALNQIRTEEERYKMLSVGLKDIVFDYDPLLKKYTASKSLYADMADEAEEVIIDNFDQYLLEVDDRISGAIQKIHMRLLEEGVVSREINFSYIRNGKKIPLWYQVEAKLLKDDDCEDYHIVGKLHNVTSVKLNNISNSKGKLSSMFMEGMEHRNSLTQKLLQTAQEYTEEDYVAMAQAHQFMASLSDQLKNAVDADLVMADIVEKIGTYLGVNRIVFLQGLSTTGVKIGFQWNSKGLTEVPDSFDIITEKDVEDIRKLYDEYGYLEYNPAHGIFIDSQGIKSDFYKYIVEGMILGTQLWIPTLHDGEYDGATFFDKYDTTPYSASEKFLMVEAVNLIASYVRRIEAENASKAKSAFLSNMSHEIRTPMNAILGMSEVALRQEMAPDIKKCIKTIRSSSQGLLGIINDILDFSKIEAGKIDIVPEEYGLMSLVNDVFIMANARNVDKGLALEFHVPEDLPSKLYGDEVRIKQIMVNLVNNAIKYTDSGSVNVYVSCEKTKDNNVNMTYKVVDTGMGIKEDDLNNLFQSYSQVDKEKNHHKEGTGLGLAISKQLVELMGGRIYVESEYGKGSTFGFTVPQRVVSNVAAGRLEDFNYEDEAYDLSSFTAEGKTILIADDNEINLEVAIALFEPLMMNIETANDGIDALEKSWNKKYDAILMDNFMPMMNGGEAAMKIREASDNPNVDTPIIALTADAVSGVKERLMECGMNDFISKPIDMQIAVRKLMKWLDYKK